MQATMKMLAEIEDVGAKFECVQNGHANLATFQAEFKETFSQQPDPIHPPLFLDCSTIE